MNLSIELMIAIVAVSSFHLNLIDSELAFYLRQSLF